MITIIDIGVLTGIIASIVAAISKTVTFIKKRDLKIANQFSGNWHNEGDITSKKRTHHIELMNLSCRGNELYGIINARNLSSGSCLPNGSLHGKRRGKNAHLKITDIHQGRLIEYGILKLALRKHILRCKMVSQRAPGLFPDEINLWR